MKADRTLSNSARCSSEKNSWLAYFGERCRGVSVSSVQIPCRSGSPHGVVNAGADAIAGGAGACAAVGSIGFFRFRPPFAATEGATLADMATRDSTVGAIDIAERIVILLSKTTLPDAFYVRLLDRSHPKFTV